MSVVEQLEPAWSLAFLRRTRMLDAEFQGDVLAVISKLSHASKVSDLILFFKPWYLIRCDRDNLYPKSPLVRCWTDLCLATMVLILSIKSRKMIMVCHAI